MQDTEVRKNILDFMPGELGDIVTGLGEQKFRAAQVFGWLSKGAASYDEMTNVPKSLREKLEAEYSIGLPEAVRMQQAKEKTILRKNSARSRPGLTEYCLISFAHRS